MTTINSSLSSLYYQLPNSASTQPDSTSMDPTALLSSALSSIDSANSSGLLPGDLLDLSPDAQNYLSSLGSASETGASGGASGESFTLTSAQQQKLNGILEQYASLPVTQQNYDNLQNALNNAGLGPNQLSLEDQAKSFDPTQVLMDALSGQSDPMTLPGTGSGDEQSKASNYMSQILQQWQSMTQANSGSAGSNTGVVAPATGAS